MRIRVTVLGLALALMVALCFACSRGKDGAPAQNTKSLRVVCVFPLTGPGASLGEFLKNGVKLAQEDLKARYGAQLDLEIELLDSKNKPGEAISALQAALALRKPDAVITALSSVSKALVPVLDQESIPAVVTTTAMADLPKGSLSCVRIYPTSRNFVEPVAKYMATKFDQVAILYVQDDFGESNQKLFSQFIQQAGKRVTASEPYQLTAKDSRVLIAKVLEAKPQAIFVTGYGPAFIAVLKQVREAAKETPLFTEIGFANPEVLAALGADADGIFFDGTPLEILDTVDPASVRFCEQYRATFKGSPYQVAGFAYDSLILIVESAMKGSGDGKPSKASMIARSPLNGVMGQITLDSDGECDVPLKMMKREQGRTVLLQP